MQLRASSAPPPTTLSNVVRPRSCSCSHRVEQDARILPSTDVAVLGRKRPAHSKERLEVGQAPSHSAIRTRPSKSPSTRSPSQPDIIKHVRQPLRDHRPARRRHGEPQRLRQPVPDHRVRKSEPKCQEAAPGQERAHQRHQRQEAAAARDPPRFPPVLLNRGQGGRGQAGRHWAGHQFTAPALTKAQQQKTRSTKLVNECLVERVALERRARSEGEGARLVRLDVRGHLCDGAAAAAQAEGGVLRVRPGDAEERADAPAQPHEAQNGDH
ncbi:hypothetical protein ON010_g12723 [Phytophthora cinnamomi]|nr:hypothetical protein ON010_g12723 [Phytophthora cinnamomi]